MGEEDGEEAVEAEVWVQSSGEPGKGGGRGSGKEQRQGSGKAKQPRSIQVDRGFVLSGLLKRVQGSAFWSPFVCFVVGS